jgi:hypothetical protein
MRAIPNWADRQKIADLYKLARRLTEITKSKWNVDHIVPLTSDKVCGLHCSENMQLLPISINVSKNNRQWPEMWDPPKNDYLKNGQYMIPYLIKMVESLPKRSRKTDWVSVAK